MTLDMWIALGILVAAIVLFVTERLRVDVVAIAVMVALMLTNLC
jgi:di/tricarboxylate transporter